MKLASLYLDDTVVIHLGKDVGGGLPRQHVRDSSFQEADGWDIRETLPGTFSICREGMPKPVTIGGYGYSYVRADDPAPPPEPKAKRR